MIFGTLPHDIVHNILSYNDKIKYRNGKYMNQICKNDTRYKLLLKIPPIRVNYFDHDIYEIFYKPTNTSLYIETINNKIWYVFCYNCEKNPYTQYIWVRQ